MEEIIIICNSPDALQVISSGYITDLHTKDIFTCNQAFSFFRTTGKHFNMFTDAPNIERFIKMPEVLYGDYQKRVHFVFSEYDLIRKNRQIDLMPSGIISPVCVGASSAMNALFFLNSFEQRYKKIILIGYSFNEWADTDKYPHLAKKQVEFTKVAKNYTMDTPLSSVYIFHSIK